MEIADNTEKSNFPEVLDCLDLGMYDKLQEPINLETGLLAGSFQDVLCPRCFM